MSTPNFAKTYGGNAAENYERYFVPAIGGPVADDLMAIADLRPGDRVLDVACGTGVVARRAAARVGAEGHVAGLDLNPGMLAVARTATPEDMTIEWHEGNAEQMPVPDASFDVVLCQMGIQFVPDKAAALSEMHRSLRPGGRAFVSVPGPTPPLMADLDEALARHVSPEAAAFVAQVFSLHDEKEMQGMLEEAGFQNVSTHVESKEITLPPPEAFLWAYVHSTPLAEAVAKLDDEGRKALEEDVVSAWQAHLQGGRLKLAHRMVVAAGTK